MPFSEDDLRQDWQMLRAMIEDDLTHCTLFTEVIEHQKSMLIHLHESGLISQDALESEIARLETGKATIEELQAAMAGRLEEGDRIFMQ